MSGSIVERLRYCAEHGIFTAVENDMHASHAEAADTIEELVEALQFYADESGWNQPPVKTVYHDILGPAYENQASKIRLDRGVIARAALARVNGLAIQEEAGE